MMLEDIVNKYGMVDYYEVSTGYTYHLSEARKSLEKEGMLRVPVSCMHNKFGSNKTIGFAFIEMEKCNGFRRN